MAILSTQNVEEYRAKFADQLKAYEEEKGFPVTDEMIVDGIYNKIKDKADVDYYSFYKSFNPKGKFSNLETYKVATDQTEADDKDIINKVYEELSLKGPVRFKDFINTFAEKPDDYDELPFFPMPDIPNLPDKEYTLKEIAEIRGINPDTDVSMVEVGFAQALATDDVDKALAAKVVLNRYFGEDVPFRYGPETEELEFLNPKTGKFELLNQYGLDEGDIAKFGTMGAYILPEIIATTVASSAGPGAAIATSAGVTALTESLRIFLGNQIYGINTTEKEGIEAARKYLSDVGELTAINSGLTALGLTLPKLYRMIRDARKFGKINASEIGGRITEAQDAYKLVEEINNTLDKAGVKPRLKFTLGQASNDDELLALQHAFESNIKYGVKSTFDTFNKEQAEALNTYFNIITGPYKKTALSGKDPIAADELGQLIKNKVLERLSPRQKALTQALEKSETDLTNAVLKLPDGSQKEAGVKIKGVIDDLYKSFDDEMDDAYETLFASGGDRRINTDIIQSVLKSLNKRTRDTFFSKYPKTSTFFKNPGKTANLQKIKNSISDLKKFQRSIVRGEVNIEGVPEQTSIARLLQAFDDQMVKDLGADDVWLLQYKKLSKDYKAGKDQFRGIIGKLMQTKNGRLVINNEDIFNQTFKKGLGQEKRIDDVYAILKQRPEMIPTYKEAILGAYRDTVQDKVTGKINLVKHVKFLNDYDYALKTFFGKKGSKEIEKIGGLAKAVEKATLKRDKLIKEFSKTTQGQLSTMDPDQIFQFAYNSKRPTTLNKIMAIVRSDDDLYKSFQSVAKQDLYNAITDNRGKFVFDNMADYLKKNRQILERTFADQPGFVKNLYRMRDALEITTRKRPANIVGRGETALNDLIRARLGQFTVAGRTFTAIKKIFRSNLNEQLAELITEPKRLKELIDLENVKGGSKAAAIAYTRLFGYNILDEQFFEDDSFSPAMIDFVDNSDVDANNQSNIQTEEDNEITISRNPFTAIETAELPKMPQQPVGLESIQAAQNFETLFPQDTLGAALARKRMT